MNPLLNKPTVRDSLLAMTHNHRLDSDLPALDPCPCFDFSGLAGVRQQLTQFDHKQLTEFCQQQDISVLVYQRSQFIDALIRQLWQYLQPEPTPTLSILAVGGYGRAQLLPKSDIDIVLLTDDEQHIQAQQPFIEKLVSTLWDLQLTLGHSVRTLLQCVSRAQDDITTLTSLLEARTLIGPDDYRQQMLKQIGPEHIWPSPDYFKAQCDEQARRYARFGDTEYCLEPNVKQSPGGLRDIQLINWIAKRHFGGQSLSALVDQQVITQDELSTLEQGQQHLWRLRFAMHMHTGRAEDRLLFDVQQALAELFGLSDNNSLLAVEQLMQTYYQWVMRLQQITEMLLQHFTENLIDAQHRPHPITPINSRFHICNQGLQTTHP